MAPSSVVVNPTMSKPAAVPATAAGKTPNTVSWVTLDVPEVGRMRGIF